MEGTRITQEDYVFRREVLERLTRLETMLSGLNGGRLSDMETEIKNIKSAQAYQNGKMVGISVAVGAALSFIRWNVIPWFTK